MIENATALHVKYPHYSCPILMKLEFL